MGRRLKESRGKNLSKGKLGDKGAVVAAGLRQKRLQP